MAALTINDAKHKRLTRACLRSLYRFRRAILLTACVLGVTQYGMVLVFGVMVTDLDRYYGLTAEEGDALYSWLNFGACALSFVPGLMYDHLGPVRAMTVGTLIGIAPVAFQLAWAPDFPYGLTTMQGLTGCYFLFGISSSFFNVIGACAPLAAFEDKDVGKVSAVVQVCLSLGLTLQSLVYTVLKSSGGDFIQEYLIYILSFLAACGTLMSLVFAVSEDLLRPRGAAAAPETVVKAGQCRSLSDLVCSTEFVYMSVVFLLGIGFSFSFLDVIARIAVEANVSPSSLSMIFGVVNCVGRAATSVPLDFTRHHPFGGVYSYILGSLLVFLCGLLFLVVPAAPGFWHMQVSNVCVAIGYGGLLGIVPPALRLEFGMARLSLIYGVLYFWVALAVPVWGLLDDKQRHCHGVACYREYCLGGCGGIVAAALLTVAMIARGARRPNALRLGLLSGATAEIA